jgi:membrane-bound ClpP family serine protease
MMPLLEVATAPGAAEGMSAGGLIAWAAVLMLLAAGLAVVEFMIVSWGMLLVGAMISAIAAIALAFHASPFAGWLFVAATPALIFLVLRTGFAIMRRNKAAVMSAEVTADAGYRHAAEAAGVAVGAVGELVTAAYPTGRARFAGRTGPVDLDVQVQGAVLPKGDRVVILAINGPVITVAAAPVTVSGLMNQTNPQG